MTLGDYDNTGENEQVAYFINLGMWMWGDVKGYVLEKKVAFTKKYKDESREDEECEKIKRFLEAAEGYPVDVDWGTQGFYRCNDAGTLPGECADFIFHKCND